MTTIYPGGQNKEDLFPEVKALSLGLQAMQKIQNIYDEEMWNIQKPDFAKLRHILLHMSILTGQLAQVCEKGEHLQARNAKENITSETYFDQLELSPIIADLLIHAAQLANLSQQQLTEVLLSRYVTNSKVFAPESQFATIDLARS